MTAPRAVFLRLDAPFAAWRWLQAGVYRGTFPVIPPSAAWGLVLNLAGIDTRGSLGEVVTRIRPDAPHLDIAVGVQTAGQASILYQQLHSYPVGSSGTELKARSKGNKFWIAPARREVLVGLVAVVGARGDAAIIDRVTKGLRGQQSGTRYGLPFAGDNQYLFSRIDVVEETTPARWYVPLEPGSRATASTRLTTNIDRKDASRTQAPLFAPSARGICPATAWVKVGPAGVTTSQGF